MTYIGKDVMQIIIAKLEFEKEIEKKNKEIDRLNSIIKMANIKVMSCHVDGCDNFSTNTFYENKSFVTCTTCKKYTCQRHLARTKVGDSTYLSSICIECKPLW